MAPPTPPHPPFPSPSGKGDRKRKRSAGDGASPSDPPAALLPPQNMSTQVTDAAVSAIADKVGDLVGTLWDYSFGLVVNIIFLSRKADEVAEEMGKLRSLQDDLKHKAEDEARQTRAKVSNQLERWATRVRSLAEDAAKFQRSLEDRSTFITRFRLGYDVVELLKRARKLAEEGNVFSGGAPLTCPRGPDPVEQVPSETLSSTLVGGREALQQVEGYIMDDSVGIIGIYGMGGVGKTTLLNLINNEFLREETCRDKFDVAVWVTVSQDVQISSIRETVARRLGLPSNTSKDELFRQLSKKRFILLLDDVWRKLDLVEIGIPLPQTMNHSGKILFTTRYEQVCGEMDADQKVKINSLHDKSSWELFRSKLGAGVAVLDNNPSIRRLAEQVMRRCGGLPIALITVGRAMSSAKTAYEWKDAIRKLDQCAAELSPDFKMTERYRLTRRRLRQILEEEEHRQSHVICESNPPMQVSEQRAENATQVPSFSAEGNSLTSSHTDTSCSSKRTRGPTLKRDIYNMPLGQRLKVDFDKLNRAIGNYSKKFAHFLGSIARNGQLLPIDIFDWRYMPEQNIQECLELVKSKFEFDVDKEKFVVASISKKWKDHKERLKSRYFQVDGDNSCPLQYLESDQWEKLVVHWKSEQGKKLSEINKKNRAKQQLISTTGPKSIAKRQHDYEEKMGQQMSLIQTFKMMYTKKNGEPSTSVAAEKFVEIDKILASQTIDGSDNNANTKDGEILTEVLGKEHPGKPRCYGSFVSSTDVYGPKNKCGRFEHKCPRVQQMEEEFTFMKNKMLEMETHYKSLEEKLGNVIHSRNQQVNYECNRDLNEWSNEENDIFHSLNPRSSVGSCVFRSNEEIEDTCYLLGFAYNRVAEGKILCKDPSKIVDGIALGEDYYEVQVTKVLCPNMRLPTNLQKTLGQCEGESILWVKNLLLEGEDDERP